MKAPQMTAEQATTFDSYSPGNAMIVHASFPCGCQPYEDVFTFNRWKAQGYHVMRGQHGVKIAKLQVIEHENESGEVERHRMLGRSVVFCRHQVEKTATNEVAA